MKNKFIAFALLLITLLTCTNYQVLAEGTSETKEILNLDLGTFSSEPGELPTYIGASFDCDRYYASSEEWKNITDNRTMESEEAFEKGKLYKYTLYIKPYDEYAISEDSRIVTGGIEWNSKGMSMAVGESHAGQFVFWGYYTPGLEAIDSINVNIDEVVAGEPLVFVEGVETGANYTIAEQQWREDIAYLPEDSVYSETGTYYYRIVFVANEGYRFTEDTTVMVNGIEWDSVDYSTHDLNLLGDSLGAHFNGEYTIRERATEEVTTEATTEVTTGTTAEATTEAVTEAVTIESMAATVADTPNTNDTTGAILWVTLLCAAAGMVVISAAVRVRKY